MRRTKVTKRIATALLARPDAAHYGYELGQQADVRSGALYPRLRCMLEEGWLADFWEPQPYGRPPRRYYMLTPSGRTELRKIVQ